MIQYIEKDAIVAEIEKRIKSYILLQQKPEMSDLQEELQYKIDCLNSIKGYILNTIEVKDDSLEKFKSLQHISGDLHQTLEDWGYAPNLYFFDGMWHVSWISCEEGDSIKDFEGSTPEEAIDKAYNWFHSTFCNN